MNSKNKLIIIAGISITLSIIGFCLDSEPNKQSVFRNAFEIMMMASLLFLIIAINFFALQAVVKKIKNYRSKTKVI